MLQERGPGPAGSRRVQTTMLRNKLQGRLGLGRLPTALDLCLPVCKVRGESSMTWHLLAQVSYLVSSLWRFRCGVQLITPYASSCRLHQGFTGLLL